MSSDSPINADSVLTITSALAIPLREIELNAIRAQGAGGQNVNKVASAVHLRFDISLSSLPDEIKTRLLAVHDQRISSDGVVVIKAQNARSQEKNREDALQRLIELIKSCTIVHKKRRPTRPTIGSRTRRLEGKKQRSQIKNLRGKIKV